MTGRPGTRDARVSGRTMRIADIALRRAAQVDKVATTAAFCATEAPEPMTGAVPDLNGARRVR